MAASREIQLVALALKDTKPSVSDNDLSRAQYSQWRATAVEIMAQLELSTPGFDVTRFKKASQIDE